MNMLKMAFLFCTHTNYILFYREIPIKNHRTKDVIISNDKRTIQSQRYKFYFNIVM